jgi:hypothetical protein
MNGEHGSHGGAGGGAAAIAAVKDGGPRQAMARAVLAKGARAKEETVGANCPEIMKRLNHRDTFRVCGVVDGGREQRECVMDVDEVGTRFPKELEE